MRFTVKWSWAAALAGISVFAASANAVLIDFNTPTYANGALTGQNGWAGDPDNLNVVNNPADGRLQFTRPVSGADRKSTFTFGSPITPDANNKIIASFDVIAGSVGGSFVGLILFKDSNNIELSRSELQAFSIRGRGAAGDGIVTTNMTVGGADPTTRTWWIELDTAANTATYYRDSIAPANIMGGTNPLPFGAGALDEVAKVEVNTRGLNTADVGLIDNINVVPEPATIALLVLGALPMLRRRRTA